MTKTRRWQGTIYGRMAAGRFPKESLPSSLTGIFVTGTEKHSMRGVRAQERSWTSDNFQPELAILVKDSSASAHSHIEQASSLIALTVDCIHDYFLCIKESNRVHRLRSILSNVMLLLKLPQAVRYLQHA